MEMYCNNVSCNIVIHAILVINSTKKAYSTGDNTGNVDDSSNVDDNNVDNTSNVNDTSNVDDIDHTFCVVPALSVRSIH